MNHTPKKQKSMDMTSGSITKLLIMFAVPLVIGNLFQQLYNTADAMIVGQFVGKQALAELDAVTVAGTQIAVAFALCLGCALAWEPMLDVAAVRPVAWGIIVFLALFSTCLAFFLQSLALDRLSSTTVSLLLTGEPVFTALFAYLFLGETLSAMGLLGAAVIVGTVVAATWADGRTGAPAAPAAPVVVSRRAVPRPRLLVSKRRDDRMAA